MSETAVEQRYERDELERLTGGTLHGGARSVTFRGAVLDSRQASPGCLFACLRGEQVDGHDYAAVAVGNGAALVLAERVVDVPVPVLVVENVTVALSALAQRCRSRYPGATWVAVTGSNGKTTCKEMIATALSTAGVVHRTRGNLNNHWGVPLTVLATPPGCRYVVVEMGANHQREIDGLARIVQPDHAVITNIGPAHLEGFGGLEGVARGKGEIFGHARSCGWLSLIGTRALAPAHDTTPERLRRLALSHASGQVPVRVVDEDDALRVLGEPPVLCDSLNQAHSLAIPGRHSVANAWLALQVAVACGADHDAALKAIAALQPVEGRLTRHLRGEHRIIDDSYNANPASMEAGLQVLAREPGARLAVLGAMGELGPQSTTLHRNVGAVAARLGVPLITVGERALPMGEGYLRAGGRDHVHCVDQAEAGQVVCARLRVGPTAVLVKASHASRLDLVVQQVLTVLDGALEGACSSY